MISTMPDQRFRKSERLRLRSDFSRVYAYRCSAAGDVLVVYAAENGLKWSRLGLSVSKKVGNAVQRQYVRRRIREAYRTNKAKLPVGFDIICIAKPLATDKKVDLSVSLCKLMKKAVQLVKRRRKNNFSEL